MSNMKSKQKKTGCEMDKIHQKLLFGTVHPYEVVQFGDAKLQFLGGFAVRLGNTMTQ